MFGKKSKRIDLEWELFKVKAKLDSLKYEVNRLKYEVNRLDKRISKLTEYADNTPKHPIFREPARLKGD
jgi:archaellum component FlaC